MTTATNSERYYFGYGSNLNQKDWDSWCREHRYASGLLTPYCVADLPDFELIFNHDSTTRGGGVLNIRKRAGQLVPGVIFEVHGEGWDALDQKEGCRRGQANGRYNRLDWVAIGPQGKELPVTAYWVPPEPSQSYVKPQPEYVQIVREGMEQQRLGDNFEMLERAAANKPIALSTDAFFVYGTLLRGESRFQILQDCGLECTLVARMFGRLVDLGSFPGLVDIGTDESMVCGDFIRVRNVEAAIERLDQVEGFRGYGRPGSLYRRALLQVDVGEAHIRSAWTYVLVQGGDQATLIPSGDWREHRGVRDDFHRRLIEKHVEGDESSVARSLAKMPPFYFNEDVEAVAKELMPLRRSLAEGLISERRLAQVSGSWVTLP
jgi:gamma-glutamylcyclotransferase (GGCT)/AIG2-like uncharacterized protein YtfP